MDTPKIKAILTATVPAPEPVVDAEIAQALKELREFNHPKAPPPNELALSRWHDTLQAVGAEVVTLRESLAQCRMALPEELRGSSVPQGIARLIKRAAKPAPAVDDLTLRVCQAATSCDQEDMPEAFQALALELYDRGLLGWEHGGPFTHKGRYVLAKDIEQRIAELNHERLLEQVHNLLTTHSPGSARTGDTPVIWERIPEEIRQPVLESLAYSVQTDHSRDGLRGVTPAQLEAIALFLGRCADGVRPWGAAEDLLRDLGVLDVEPAPVPVETVPMDVRITDVLRAAAECAAVWPRSSACGVLGQSLEQLGLVVSYIDPSRTRGSGYRVPDDLEARLEALRQPPRYVIGVDLANSSDDVPTATIIEVPVRCRDCGLQGVEHCSACKGMRESAAEIARMVDVRPAPVSASTAPTHCPVCGHRTERPWATCGVCPPMRKPAPIGPASGAADALAKLLGEQTENQVQDMIERRDDLHQTMSDTVASKVPSRAELGELLATAELLGETQTADSSPVGDPCPSLGALCVRLCATVDPDIGAEQPMTMPHMWRDAQDRDARMALGFGTLDRLVEAAERGEIAWSSERGWFKKRGKTGYLGHALDLEPGMIKVQGAAPSPAMLEPMCLSCNDTGKIDMPDGLFIKCGMCELEEIEP